MRKPKRTHQKMWKDLHPTARLCGQTTELDPTLGQSAFFGRCVGAARFVWNRALGRRLQVDDAKDVCPDLKLKVPTAADLHHWFVQDKQGELAWLYELPKDVVQQTLRELAQAFTNLYEHGYGYPKFKVKKRAKRSFTISGDKVEIADNAIRLPHVGWVRLKERGYLLPEVPDTVHVYSATVSEMAGRWYISLNIGDDATEKPVETPTQVVGIDFNVGRPEDWAVLSDGSHVEQPQALRARERKLARLQRRASEKLKGSNRRRKAERRVARFLVHICSVRKDFIEKAMTSLAKAKRVYVVEDLNVDGMMRSRLAKSVADASMSTAIRRLEQKAPWYGSAVLRADRFYPSTQRCSSCGHVKTGAGKLSLGATWYVCQECGFQADRQYNAAWNLQQWPAVRGTLETDGTGSKDPPSSENLLPSLGKFLGTGVFHGRCVGQHER